MKDRFRDGKVVFQILSDKKPPSFTRYPKLVKQAKKLKIEQSLLFPIFGILTLKDKRIDNVRNSLTLLFKSHIPKKKFLLRREQIEAPEGESICIRIWRIS